jgi:WD40 repeat protein
MAFIAQLQVSPDGRTLVSAGETTFRVWDVAPPPTAPSRLRRLLLGRVRAPTDDGAIDGRAERFAISRDGRWVVALKPWRHACCGDPEVGHDAGRVTEVQVFELATGNLQSTFFWPGQLLDLDFSPDGRWLAAVGNVRQGRVRRAEVQLWATRTLLRPGARPAPDAEARLQLPRGQRASTVPAALRFVPDSQAYPAARPRPGAASSSWLGDRPAAANWPGCAGHPNAPGGRAPTHRRADRTRHAGGQCSTVAIGAVPGRRRRAGGCTGSATPRVEAR